MLEARLEAEAEARRALQRRLEEQRCEADHHRRELGAQYEKRLTDLCRRLEATSAEAGSSASGLRGSILAGGCCRLDGRELHVLTSARREAAAKQAPTRHSFRNHPRVPPGSQQVTLTGDELEALRRQAAEQEMLVAALNEENQLAAQRLQQLRAEQQHVAAEAASQVEELQRALAAALAERERQPPGTQAVDAARLQELLRLQGELEAARAAAAQHDAELRRQVGDARA